MKLYKGYLIKVKEDGTCFIQKLNRKYLRDYASHTEPTLKDAKVWIDSREI